MNSNNMNNSTPTENGDLTFLEAVAAAYANCEKDLSEYCFLFPNKRAGTFFLKSLTECIGNRTILAPKVMTMTDFMTDLSGLTPASRIDLVFRLYNVYRRLLGKSSSISTDEEALEFDRFAPWAEVIISDFNEVERYNVDAEKLFLNVKDYQEISSNFLTPEQIEIMERYFGYTPTIDSVDRFWKSLKPEETSSKLRERFVYLWQLLPDLFEGLLEDLKKEGLCILGSAYRIALQKAEESEGLPGGWKRVVAVGFNSLSTTEDLLFTSLRSRQCEDGRPYIEFFWDATGPVLSDSTMGPGREMARNIRNFPQPEWAEPWMARARRDTMPGYMSVEAAPSNSAQVKIAELCLEEMLGEDEQERKENAKHIFEDARTAVILPDDNLLLPLLYSLPDEISTVNLTMGFSMRYTAVSSFINHLRKLQTGQRTSHGETGFYFENLKEFLGHPLLHIMIGNEQVNAIIDHIEKHHRYVVTIDEIRTISKECADLLTPPANEASAQQSIDYLHWVMDQIDAALIKSGDGQDLKASIEHHHIVHYRNALQQLSDCVEKYHITMRFGSIFRLADRLIAGEKIPFEGEPLEGLQILGMLETRSIDFDKIIILSANDKVLPTRARKRSFIPDALRVGYGLPLSSAAEELYAYYFWRLLSRAKEVTIIYDARAGEGMRSGGKSRFLLQLDLLYGKGIVKHNNYAFTLNSTDRVALPIEKTTAIMARLDEFRRKEKSRNLSASSLKKYTECQVKFYYESVVGVSDDPEMTDYIDAITTGNIVHRVMQNIYVPKKDHERYLNPKIEISKEFINTVLNTKGMLTQKVREAVNEEHYHLPEEELNRELTGTAKIVAKRLESIIRDILTYDCSIAPFTVVGTEIRGHDSLKINEDLSINMSYAFDRVDIKDGKWRIVDYKTGKACVEAKSMDDIFDGTYTAKNLLQLMIYANLLRQRAEAEGDPDPGNIGLSIYCANDFSKDEGDHIAKIGKKLTGYLDCNEEFMARFRSMVEEIFDKDVQFKPTEDSKACTYCRISSLCGKR
jgi:hypothetical protein